MRLDSYRLTTLMLSLALLLTLALACSDDRPEPTAAPAGPSTAEIAAVVQQALQAQPQGASAEDVAATVQAALDARPGVTEAQVADAIARTLRAQTPGLTEAQVADAIAKALAERPGVTEAQVAEAIVRTLRAQTPGLTEAQVADAIAKALAERPGVTQEDVQAAVASALSDAMATAVPPQVPFRIGVMESVTGPGETYGRVAVQAKQMATAEINAAGGINGRMLELIVEDEKCNAQDSIVAYNKLTDVDGVKIILGTSCSGAMLGAAPLAEADGVILFSGLATNPDIANAGDYIFRTSMNDAQLGIDTGNELWADGIRKLATITEATDYAEGVRRTTVAQFEKLGGEVVGEERYASDVTDFRSQLTKLLGANPDAIHVAAQSEFAGGTIVKQVRELGYEGGLYSEVVPVGATALEIAGEAATGVKAVTADLDPNNDKAKDVLANFRESYGYVTLAWYLGSAYDDVYIAAECLKRTNDDQDADGFRDCMYDITWSGSIGENYSFDEKGEVVGLSNVVVEVLPVAERTEDNQGYKVLGGAPTK